DQSECSSLMLQARPSWRVPRTVRWGRAARSWEAGLVSSGTRFGVRWLARLVVWCLVVSGLGVVLGEGAASAWPAPPAVDEGTPPSKADLLAALIGYPGADLVGATGVSGVQGGLDGSGGVNVGVVTPEGRAGFVPDLGLHVTAAGAAVSGVF